MLMQAAMKPDRQDTAAGRGKEDRGPSEGRSLDTLAQLPRRASEGHTSEALEVLQRRARAKWMSVPLATSLAELRRGMRHPRAKPVGMEKSYRNTIYCASTLLQPQVGEKLQAQYCGNRWCLVCNRVRTARAINRYSPELDTWNRGQFVTLTAGPTVPADELRARIEAMVKGFSLVNRKLRERVKIKWRGVRKLECTARPGGLYHPHFHVVVDTPEAAQLLVGAWLDQFPEAVKSAQDIRAADRGSMVELFKYFTKLVTRNEKTGSRSIMEAARLDVIFEAMQGRRVYQPYGFKVSADAPDEDAAIGEDGDTDALTGYARDVVWSWEQDFHDWCDRSTGELLTEYQPSRAAQSFVHGELLENRIEQGERATPNEQPSASAETSEASCSSSSAAQEGSASGGGACSVLVGVLQEVGRETLVFPGLLDGGG